MRFASYDSTWSMILIFALLIATMIAMVLVPFMIARVIRAHAHRRKIARERSIANDAVRIGELIVRDNAELEARAQRLLESPRAATLHATAHYALAMVDDRRGNFTSMKEHLRFAVAALDRAPVLPTEKDAREMRETRDAATLFFAFALAASGDLDEAEEQLKKQEPVSEQHVGLRLRAAALILARRKEWTALDSVLSAPFEELPMLGPSSKLLLRVLKERAARGQAYRSNAAAAPDNAEADPNEATRRKWVAKAIGEEGAA